MKRLITIALFQLLMLSALKAQSLPSGVPTSGFDVYSTSETITNKVWINGKFIYRKVVYLGTLPNATVATTAHGLSNVTFTSVTGMMYASGAYTMNLPFAYPYLPDGYCVGLQASSTVVEIRTGNGVFTAAGYVAYAVLEYTKN